MRRVDTLAVTGVLMLIVGATTFLEGSSMVPLWVAWLVGPLFWYMGFAVLISWLLYRLFIPAAQPAEAVEEPVRKKRAAAVVSNFHEHDYQAMAEPVRYKIPAFGTAVLLVVLSVLTVIQR